MLDVAAVKKSDLGVIKMANKTPDKVRGFLVPFKNQTNSNYWESQSSISQGTGRSGLNSDVGNDLVIQTNGKQSKSIDIKTLRGGHIYNNPTFGWKKRTDTDYNGFDQPNKLIDLQTFDDFGSKKIVRDALTLPNNNIITVYEQPSGSDGYIYVKIKKTTSLQNSTLVLLSNGIGSGLGSHFHQFPCLCLLPDETIILAHWTRDPDTETANTVS